MTDRRIPWGAAVVGFFLFVVVVSVVVAVRPRDAPEPVRQPISFNHRKHVEDNALACSTCHQFYEKEAFSGLPSAEDCAVCHLEAQGKSAEESKLVGLLKAGAPLEWKPLFRQPAHVFYSHRRHVIAGKLDCRVCHGAIADDVRAPGPRPAPAMNDCVDCHRREGVSTDCTTCHR